jgi:hypothetical protein
MSKELFKWIDSMAAFFFVGPLAAWIVHARLRAPDGDPATTPLTSASPVLGFAVLVLAAALAMGMGVAAGKVFTRGRGYTIAGIVLAWVAWIGGTSLDLLGKGENPSVPYLLAAEGLGAGVLVVLIAIMIEGFSPVAPEEAGPPHQSPLAPLGVRGAIGSMCTPHAFQAAALAAVSAGLLGGLAAFTTGRGQAIAAGMIGGIAAGAASHLMLVTREHSRPPSLVPGILGVVLLATAAPLIASFYHGQDLDGAARAVDSVYRGQLLGIARLLPLAWLAGGLLGVPIGAGWAVAMLDMGPNKQPA